MILTFSTWPAYGWLERRLRQRPALAVLIMTVFLGLAFVLPLILIATTLADAVTLAADALLVEWGRSPETARGPMALGRAFDAFGALA
jgi:predicted PurR-regulated permease PerM